MALQWQSVGAPRLHLVDLDGAANGEIANLEIINEIAGALLIPTQLGGGIRRLDTIEQLLKAGLDRVVLGTTAVEDPELVKQACARFGENIIVGIDARNGFVATHGWQQDTKLPAAELALAMVKLGVGRFIYTDISRDGTLTEPNFSAFSELLHTVRRPIVASGGVSSLNHLRMLKALGAEGVIVGRALYTGDIDLKTALSTIF
jgi:phosphoribosylformimino-5-aminoimidazole carboxamide ribotide isomerase